MNSMKTNTGDSLHNPIQLDLPIVTVDEYPSGRGRQIISDGAPPNVSTPIRQRREEPSHNKFLFIQIKDKKIIQDLSDLKSEFSPPNGSSTNIHITVNGPKRFFKKIGADGLKRKIEKYKADHPCIVIGGVGRFFNPDVQIVYMKVDCGDLRKYKLWEKPDYKYSYNPHITIYEGQDKKMAAHAYERLKSLDKKYKCTDYEFLVHTVAQSDLNP
uniref:2'-5' RNA ligase n=1 Tax=Candidatus Kentrum sp. TC TaxID=2126339 RepID=A0A450Z9C8_9GAMM|nr:MAG: hypothetical protein BECKTC1821D_GA0114238_11006 [Candidatus Kentron sp. TC]